MKILTHKFVIYDDGWKFEWEKNDHVNFKIPPRELMLWIAIIYLAYFN